MTTQAPYEIVYAGPGVAAELWGGTQANFVIDRPHAPGRESAVLMNDAAAVYLAEQLGVANTPEFRETAARFAGKAFIQHVMETYNRVDSYSMIAAADLREQPHLVEAVRDALDSHAPLLVERAASQH